MTHVPAAVSGDPMTAGRVASRKTYGVEALAGKVKRRWPTREARVTRMVIYHRERETDGKVRTSTHFSLEHSSAVGLTGLGKYRVVVHADSFHAFIAVVDYVHSSVLEGLLDSTHARRNDDLAGLSHPNCRLVGTLGVADSVSDGRARCSILHLKSMD